MGVAGGVGSTGSCGTGSKTINGADVAATLYTIIESCKKASLQPKVYLKYLITERWHKREPLSPLRYSWNETRKT